MTEKELLYVEDAIGHEKTIIKVCEDTINKLQSEELKTFMENEIQIHQNTQDELIKLLEVKTNEWSDTNG